MKTESKIILGIFILGFVAVFIKPLLYAAWQLFSGLIALFMLIGAGFLIWGCLIKPLCHRIGCNRCNHTKSRDDTIYL